MKPNRKPRRTLVDVRRELIAGRIMAFVAWRTALARFWRLDLLWRAIQYRYANARKEHALRQLLKHSMAFDWRDSRPKKLQRKLGLLPPI